MDKTVPLPLWSRSARPAASPAPQFCSPTCHNLGMTHRVLRVRVPSGLLDELDAEANRMQVNRSVVARWRLTGHTPGPAEPAAGSAVSELDQRARRRGWSTNLDDAA